LCLIESFLTFSSWFWTHFLSSRFCAGPGSSTFVLLGAKVTSLIKQGEVNILFDIIFVEFFFSPSNSFVFVLRIWCFHLIVLLFTFSQIFRFVTPVFLHAGIFHLLLNVLAQVRFFFVSIVTLRDHFIRETKIFEGIFTFQQHWTLIVWFDFISGDLVCIWNESGQVCDFWLFMFSQQLEQRSCRVFWTQMRFLLVRVELWYVITIIRKQTSFSFICIDSLSFVVFVKMGLLGAYLADILMSWSDSNLCFFCLFSECVVSNSRSILFKSNFC
jgi:hypothetical protein